jgi:hypothetical protein
MFDAEMTQSNDVNDESFPCNKSDEPIDNTPLATKSAHSGSIEIESEEEDEEGEDDDDKESSNEIENTE